LPKKKATDTINAGRRQAGVNAGRSTGERKNKEKNMVEGPSPGRRYLQRGKAFGEFKNHKMSGHQREGFPWEQSTRILRGLKGKVGRRKATGQRVSHGTFGGGESEWGPERNCNGKSRPNGDGLCLKSRGGKLEEKLKLAVDGRGRSGKRFATGGGDGNKR